MHVVFRISSGSFGSIRAAAAGLGKLIAFRWHRGSHAWQPLTQFRGWATFALPFSKEKTSLGQYSTHRGLPELLQPSHSSKKIVGNHGVDGCTFVSLWFFVVF